MKNRYAKNLGSLTAEEISRLNQKNVCVVGCGGLGGYAIEYLLRLGVGGITAVDGDCFEETNLNRQLLCTADNIGKSKVQAAKERAQRINPEVRFNAVDVFIDKNNAADIIAASAMVIDALDNNDARKILLLACAAAGKTLIHGAVEGWQAQIAVISPKIKEQSLFENPTKPNRGMLSFVPAYCAAIQAAECAKLLCGRKSELADKLLCVDLLNGESHVIELA